MVNRFRQWEENELITKNRIKKQIIIGITANRADDYYTNLGFQEVAAKPLGYKELEKIILKYL